MARVSSPGDNLEEDNMLSGQWQALIWKDAKERTGELSWNVEGPEQKAEGLDLIPTWEQGL